MKSLHLRSILVRYFAVVEVVRFFFFFFDGTLASDLSESFEQMIVLAAFESGAIASSMSLSC